MFWRILGESDYIIFHATQTFQGKFKQLKCVSFGSEIEFKKSHRSYKNAIPVQKYPSESLNQTQSRGWK